MVSRGLQFFRLFQVSPVGEAGGTRIRHRMSLRGAARPEAGRSNRNLDYKVASGPENLWVTNVEHSFPSIKPARPELLSWKLRSGHVFFCCFWNWPKTVRSRGGMSRVRKLFISIMVGMPQPQARGLTGNNTQCNEKFWWRGLPKTEVDCGISTVNPAQRQLTNSTGITW